MKIGVLGMGIGKIFAKVCKKLGYEPLVFDTERKKCQGFQFEPELIKKCDYIIVCLPDFLHYPVTKRLLKKKKNVLLVKPATGDFKKLKELYRLAIKKNVIFKVALNNRFRKEIPQKSWDVFKGEWFGSLNKVPRWRKKNDFWLDLGIHLLDLYLFSFSQRRNIRYKGIFQIGYVKNKDSYLRIKWFKNKEIVSEVFDGIKGRFNDEYTFEACVKDWLQTKETKEDKIFLKILKDIKVLLKQKNVAQAQLEP